MSDAIGDQHARAELLGKLLLAIGEKPYLLKYYGDRWAGWDKKEYYKEYYVVMVPVKDEEVLEWKKKSSGFFGPQDEGALEWKKKNSGFLDPQVIPIGPLKLMPLQLEKGLKLGWIEKRLYDPADGGWSATIAVMRYK